MTMLVVRPEAWRERNVRAGTYMGGIPRASNMICAMHSRFAVGVEVQGDVAQLPLGAAHDFQLGDRREEVVPFCQDLNQVLGETSPPVSMTKLVVRPEAQRETTAWMDTYTAGTWRAPNMIRVMRSQFTLVSATSQASRGSWKRQVQSGAM